MASVAVSSLVEKFAEDFTSHLDAILVDISSKYNIDLEELQESYLGDYKSDAPKKTRKAPKKKESDDERNKCKAKTAKGDPCKNNALTGTDFCRCHTKDKGPAKEKAPKKSTKRTKKAVVHTHTESESDSECEACNVLGDEASTSKVPEVKEETKTRIDDILANIENSDGEEEIGEEALKKELFGSDSE